MKQTDFIPYENHTRGGLGGGGPQKSLRLTACLKYKCLLSFGFSLATHFSLKLSDLSLLDVEVCEHSLVI